MISDVTLSALANWLGSLTMILIVLYHALSVNVKRNQESARRVTVST
ncbi:uncharacterized protein UTRI_04777_B [Ustilago trichophora]|uniref:Dolichyl-diphosphooligosaccharide--protein glycosyltransferase subunit 4 n=1 Tax=Ustilago trichophora TaxID=86804 RepID=A0A5C3EG51_9BASI|nr:uncharacterized protein UTRI_04777_B [Ustilago trichophora]